MSRYTRQISGFSLHQLIAIAVISLIVVSLVPTPVAAECSVSFFINVNFDGANWHYDYGETKP